VLGQQNRLKKETVTPGRTSTEQSDRTRQCIKKSYKEKVRAKNRGGCEIVNLPKGVSKKIKGGGWRPKFTKRKGERQNDRGRI